MTSDDFQRELSQVLKDRRQKLASLVQKGINPYANDFGIPAHTSADVRAFIGKKSDAEMEESGRGAFSLAGRVVSLRDMGKALFIDLLDRKGKLQIYIKKDLVGEEQFEWLKRLDEGDIIGVKGPAMVTKRGEPSISVREAKFLTKNLQPTGDKYHGVTDTETRYRKRYIDLSADWQKGLRVQEIFRWRAEIIRTIRAFLDRRDFLEVETPILHHGVSGATAKPFSTHHNALDLDLRLRIAPELYLKRLLVGGLERVYEIGKNFRNEGISTQHNPEFTMLEFYWAYATYEDLITLTEELMVEIGERLLALDEARKERGLSPLGNIRRHEEGHIVLQYGASELSLKRPFARYTMKEAICQFYPQSARANIPFTPSVLDDEAALAQLLSHRAFGDPNTGKNLTEHMTHGQRIAFLFEHVAEPFLIQPTFITDFPLDVSPLSRTKESDPSLVDRFEFYMASKEIANAFSELNDPEEQKRRFIQQMQARERGDEEAMDYDADYIHALEVGMPPAGGQGIGIDRLTMLFTDMPSIREVILFPLLRPEGVSSPAQEKAPGGSVRDV